MIGGGLANTPLINYFFYKQSTIISGSDNEPCFPILSIADGGNGQLVITTNDTSTLTAGVGVTITGTTSYDGNYSVISLTPTTFNVSGTFGVTETGCWELSANMTGANAGDPLDFGEIFFFNATITTLLQDTFSDRDLTIANTNPLILDANGSAPVIYLGNPSGQDEPYYIEIYDKFNNLVATLDNYFPDSTDVPGSEELPIENLLPNYGFDTKINDNIYSETTLPASGTNPVTLGWFWEIETSEPNPNNTYQYFELGDSGLTGNPKNELRIRSTNNSSGQSVNNLYAVLGTYNMFQDQQLIFSIYTQLFTGSSTTLGVQLVRTKQGAPETPISVGSIDITSSQTQQTLIFTVDPLTTSDYDNNDELRLVINCPLNEDIQYGFTGTWCQLSPDGDIQISETAVSTRTAKQWFGNGAGEIAQEEQYKIRGLPASVGANGFLVLAKTGTIFQGGTTQDAIDQYEPFAASMVANGDVGEAPILVRDEIIGETQTTRLIDYLRTNGYTQSRNTFIATTTGTNVVSVELGIGATENSTWVSNAIPDITVNKSQDELIYLLSAIPYGNGKVRFTFTEMFAASTNAFNPSYVGLGFGLAYTTLPTPSPMINWIGDTDWDTSWWLQDDATLRFTNYVDSTTVNVGSLTEFAVVDFSFVGNSSNSHAIRDFVTPASPSVNANLRNKGTLYEGYTSGIRQYQVGASFAEVDEIQAGFIGYNTSLNNPATQTVSPPIVINFGATPGQTARTGSDGTVVSPTLTVQLSKEDTAGQVARKISEAVNTSWIYEIEIVNIPMNAQTVDISVNALDLILIYWDIALFPNTRPSNPDVSRKPIYVQFISTSQTIDDIADATRDALNAGVMGVPRAADLGFYFPENTQFYMFL